MTSLHDAFGTADPFDLNRFVQAQEEIYKQALSEIEGREKQTHWMWYIFPQLDGLAFSPTSRKYSIKSVAEARAYLEHIILGSRLLECANAVVRIDGVSVEEIFGSPDDLKLRSCATLFAHVSPQESVFEQLIDKCFRVIGTSIHANCSAHSDRTGC